MNICFDEDILCLNFNLIIKNSGQSAMKEVSTILEGFKLSDKKTYPKKVYPPPDLPKDYRPFHRCQKQTTGGSRWDVKETVKEKAPKEKLDPHSRAALLGEKPVIGKIKKLIQYSIY